MGARSDRAILPCNAKPAASSLEGDGSENVAQAECIEHVWSQGWRLGSRMSIYCGLSSGGMQVLKEPLQLGVSATAPTLRFINSNLPGSAFCC